MKLLLTFACLLSAATMFAQSAPNNGYFPDNPSGLLHTPSTCRVKTDISISSSGTAVTVCQWTLPYGQATWSYHCDIGWAISAGTTPTFSLGINSQRTPNTATVVYAEIKTTNTGTATEGSAALNAFGALNVLTSPTLTTSATLFQASAWGVIDASATGGTFTITATGTGTSVGGVVKAGTQCVLQ